MEPRQAFSDPGPAVADADADAESVCSADSVKTKDIFPWNWNVNLPRFALSVSVPGWFIVLCTVLLFRGPKEC